MKKFKYASPALMIGVMLSTSFVPVVANAANEAQGNTEAKMPDTTPLVANDNDESKLQNAGYKKVSTVSQDIQNLEASGVNMHAVLGDKAYKDALIDMHGGTYVKRINGGYKIALNSAVIKGIIIGGTSAAMAAVGYGLSQVGCPAPVIGDVCSLIYVTLKYASRNATRRGGYMTVTRSRIAHHHRHKTTYTYGKWHAHFGIQ